MTPPALLAARRRAPVCGAGLLALLLAACGSRAAEGERTGPSLLVVTLDTTRADRIGCYGHPGGGTPNIDRLARTGIRFTHAFSTAPLTLPAHASLWTGQIPPRHGVRDNGSFRLGAEADTLAEILADRGLRTGAFVGAYVLDRRFGLDQGFERYDDRLEPGAGDASDGAAAARRGFYEERSGERVTDSALAWLEELEPHERFFAWVHYFDPHFPYEPAPGFEAPGRSAYEAEVAAVDAQVGRLVSWLAARTRLEDTLIVVTSDHGEALGEHEEVTHGRLVHDATMRVPLVLSNPVLFPAARVVGDSVASLVDVVPTVLALLEEPARGAVDGLDLLGEGVGRDRAVYLETLGGHLRSGWAPLFALRRVHDKFVQAPRAEYYDLSADPGELQNLGADRPGARELQRTLEDLLAAVPALPPQVAAVDEDDRRRLAALGYADVVQDAADPDGELPDPKDRMPAFNRLMLARTLLAEGLREEALRELLALLGEEPRNANAWEVAFNAYTDLGRWRDAERAAREAARWRPTAEAYVALARVLHRNGHIDEFRAALGRAEELDPNEGGIYVARGNHLAQLGNYEQALREFERALEVDPGGAGAAARDQIAAVRRRLGGD